MALKISKNSGLTDIVSDANPITTQHPTTGSAQEVKVWLFNDDATKTYQGISIDPTDASGGDESTWFQLAPDASGSAGSYGAASAALSMANITSANVGVPLWLKVTVPAGQSVQNKSDIKLTVNYTEFAV
ncbi:hypothetical protein ACHHV8_25375 [Paenibacillus sp. TAB 01]|uniref:hypothetical protein n=1 Tax=Paenibacillus sp. TAB 01 TaxID=3368988 RepID=UPI00375388B3